MLYFKQRKPIKREREVIRNAGVYPTKNRERERGFFHL